MHDIWRWFIFKRERLSVWSPLCLWIQSSFFFLTAIKTGWKKCRNSGHNILCIQIVFFFVFAVVDDKQMSISLSKALRFIYRTCSKMLYQALLAYNHHYMVVVLQTAEVTRTENIYIHAGVCFIFLIFFFFLSVWSTECPDFNIKMKFLHDEHFVCSAQKIQKM